MAFVRTVELTHDLEANLFSANGEYIWQLAVGYDDKSEATISLLVCLSPLPGGMLEFAFAIIEADSGYEYKYSDGLETKTKIPNLEDRKILLDLICRAIAALVNKSRADEVFCSVFTPDLPDKAVRKFLAIMEKKLMEETPARHRRLLDRLLSEPAVRAEVHKPVRKTKRAAKAFTRTKVKVAACG